MHIGQFQGFEITMQDPGIAVIRFDRPETLNAFTHRCKRDLMEAVAQAQMDDAVRVLLFTGSGSAFAAGDDLSATKRDYDPARSLVPDIPRGHHNPSGTYNALRTISQALNVAVRNLDKLTIAAINGFAIQTGLSLALSCDFRIAASTARLGSGTLRFGLLPDEGGQFLLVQLLGVARTMDFLLRNRIVSAEEALSLGLVHEVVEPEALEARSLELARELAEGPQVAMRMLKRSILNAAEMNFAHALDDIASKTAVTDPHPDAREGVAAFREKRKPRFNQWLEAR